MMDKCRRALGSLKVTHCFTVLMADSGDPVIQGEQRHWENLERVSELWLMIEGLTSFPCTAPTS